MDTPTVIMSKLDKWVAFNGTGKYIPFDFNFTSEKTFALQENFGIQQNRDEIKEFMEFICKFLKEFESSKDYIPIKLEKIIHSKHMGIAYYIKP